MTPWFQALHDFKVAFLRHHLSMGDSVAATARRLGIARTYLVRLKREFGVEGPRPCTGRRRKEIGS